MQCLTIVKSCYDYTSCDSCVGNNRCLWCSSLQRCVESSLYPHLYPYGQCLGWQDNGREHTRCPGEVVYSEQMHTCMHACTRARAHTHTHTHTHTHDMHCKLQCRDWQLPFYSEFIFKVSGRYWLWMVLLLVKYRVGDMQTWWVFWPTRLVPL